MFEPSDLLARSHCKHYQFRMGDTAAYTDVQLYPSLNESTGARWRALAATTPYSEASRPSILWPILIMVVGTLAIMLPMAASIGVGRFVGWLMVFDGVVQGVHAFRSKDIGRLSWKLLLAVLYLTAGIYFLLHPFLAAAALTLALALFFFVHGVLELISCLSSRKGRGSLWLLFNGAISTILGAMIWRHWPSSSLWALGQLVGIGMLTTGMARLMMALALRRRAAEGGKAHIPDVLAA